MQTCPNKWPTSVNSFIFSGNDAGARWMTPWEGLFQDPARSRQAGPPPVLQDRRPVIGFRVLYEVLGRASGRSRPLHERHYPRHQTLSKPKSPSYKLYLSLIREGGQGLDYCTLQNQSAVKGRVDPVQSRGVAFCHWDTLVHALKPAFPWTSI